MLYKVKTKFLSPTSINPHDENSESICVVSFFDVRPSHGVPQ